jgi:hypothetical protein
MVFFKEFGGYKMEADKFTFCGQTYELSEETDFLFAIKHDFQIEKFPSKEYFQLRFDKSRSGEAFEELFFCYVWVNKTRYSDQTYYHASIYDVAGVVPETEQNCEWSSYSTSSAQEVLNDAIEKFKESLNLLNKISKVIL